MQPFIAFLLLAPVQVLGTASPIAKVISMLSDLEAQIRAEGEAADKEYAKFTHWCEDRSRNLGFEIQTGKSDVEELKAAIAKEVATSSSLSTKIEELVAGIATDTADLKAAGQIRSQDAADFAAEEKELMETIDILKRAIQILEHRMQGGASLMQLQGANNLVSVLSAMVEASVIGTSDAAKLTAFVQAAQKSSDEDDEPGAPAASVYESKSGSIVDTLESLLEKAEGQLDAARKKETAATHNYEMLRQSLEDEIANANKELEDAKKGLAASAEKKSVAQGDLEATSKELASDISVKETLHQDCISEAEEHHATSKSRAEELSVLAAAKKAIKDATDHAFDQVSFLQVARSSLSSAADLANFEAVRLVRDLAHKQHSPELAQLASRMASVIRAGGADPFEKVKGLIVDLINKLEKEAGADATKKAYCDKELQETKAKKLEKSTEIEMLGTRIDQMTAKSMRLKQEVATLQQELSKLSRSQAEMDKLRHEEHDAYVSSKVEQDKGLEGVKLALKLLREYYYSSDAAHNTAKGAATGIIGLLETIESDMMKAIAALMSEEESAVAEYETMSRRNEIDRSSKEQDVKYKTQESKSLDKSTAEYESDRRGVQAELDAILEYLSRIEEQCVAKPEAYADRARHREAEIEGLKQALHILESEAVLLQRFKKHHTLRGSLVLHL